MNNLGILVFPKYWEDKRIYVVFERILKSYNQQAIACHLNPVRAGPQESSDGK